MKGDASCPRCGRPVAPPDLTSSVWRCAIHGPVAPLWPAVAPNAKSLAATVLRASVPVWMPWPLPTGWLATGFATAGDERSGATGVAVACSGPAPLGGMGEWVIIAEEPGVGLGAWYAGVAGTDPGPPPATVAPHARIHAAGQPTSLWCVDGGTDRAIYVGEAKGQWLWLILWPESAGVLLVEDIRLVDLRDIGWDVAVPYGALSPRLGGFPT
jgi:hypothetical protein